MPSRSSKSRRKKQDEVAHIHSSILIKINKDYQLKRYCEDNNMLGLIDAFYNGSNDDLYDQIIRLDQQWRELSVESAACSDSTPVMKGHANMLSGSLSTLLLSPIEPSSSPVGETHDDFDRSRATANSGSVGSELHHDSSGWVCCLALFCCTFKSAGGPAAKRDRAKAVDPTVKLLAF